MKNDLPVQEIGEMLDMVAEKLPGLFKEIQQVLFSPEGAQAISTAVGTFYKNLLAAGMEKDDALYLTQEYMSSFKSLMPSELKKS